MSGTASTDLSLPHPSWLPLHRAQFYFFPHFVQPGKGFVEEVRILLKRLAGQPITIKEGGIDCVHVESGEVRLIIDAQSGIFELQSIEHDWPFTVTQSMDEDPNGLPGVFFDELEASQFKTEFKADGEILRTIALQLWTALQRRFYSALSDSSVELYGRWRSIDARFSRVSPDQWSHFAALEFERVEVPIADGYETRSILRGREGEVVYCLYASNSRRLIRSKGDASNDRAIGALVAELRDRPDNPRTKAIVKAEFHRRFNVSGKTFDEIVWPGANERVPTSKARKPGRRKSPTMVPEV